MAREIAKHEPQMVRYEAACRALAEAKAVDEVQELRSKADAMRVYAMQAKNKRLEVDAAEIRIRAERRLGELIIEQKAGEGLAKPGPKSVVTDDRIIPTLADAGISKDLSSRAQKLAAVPKQEFEAEVDEWRGRVEAENARVVTRLETAGERAATKPVKGAPTVESLQAEIAHLREELDETRENARGLADQLESYIACEEGLHAAAKALAKEKGIRHTVESQRDQWMTKANEAIKTIRAKDRLIAALEKKYKAAA